MVASSGDKPLPIQVLKSAFFKAVKSEQERNELSSSDSPKKKIRFVSVVAAATAEINKSRKISDDILQRDLAVVVTHDGRTVKQRTPSTIHRMSTMKLRTKSPTGMVMNRAQSHASLQMQTESKIGSLDGRTILRYESTRVLLPHHLTKQLWNSFVLMIGTFEFFSMPYAVAFADGQPAALLLSVDAVFFIDVALNFITAFHEREHQKLILDRHAIAYNYLTSYFVPDMIALLPLWAISRLQPYIQLIKLFRLRYLGNLFVEKSITSEFSVYYEV